MPDKPCPTSVSVALCTRDGSRFVAEQVRSILEQTLTPDELVLSDDASADDTVAIVRALIDEYLAGRPQSGLRLLVLENAEALGIRRNFEQALSNCQGDVIALCDQDDRWRSDRLETMVREFDERDDILLVHSDAELIDETGTSLGRTLSQTQGLSSAERAELHGGRGLDLLLRRSVATGATVAFRRTLLENALPVPGSWIHDEWLAVVASATGRIDFLPRVLGDYRQHSGNQIGVRRRGPLAKVRRLFEPRSARNRRLVDRSEVLVARLEGVGAASAVIERVRAKLDHERMREALPKNRLLRVSRVLTAYRAGTYDRFGRGRRDVARDLLQPPG